MLKQFKKKVSLKLCVHCTFTTSPSFKKNQKHNKTTKKTTTTKDVNSDIKANEKLIGEF